ncbi:hypothetical protein EOL70_10550 [Leucothrix sargassi]|nr:hypothetical protein EOL70_10550 [Leucothrix sargassi]
MDLVWKRFMNNRTFLLPDNRGEIILTGDVLSHINNFSQTSVFDKEAGGQLFSTTPNLSRVLISVATGPHKEDKRSRFSFNLDVTKAMQDRFSLFEKGLHPVGLWHTHPEKDPYPSKNDRLTTHNYLDAFQGDMQGFLSVIIGNKRHPPNLVIWCAWKNKKHHWCKLEELSS